ncbi:disks large-associated protein 1 [Elysia marginata]|uniref:Disks large-associated protein 1 n=1 Tax=Elysia marginata TaxID=1093978 RepID=A0AAV4I5I9_9GAST|nr:disks large-associated protein 1 [Elysia marginata]
MDTEGPVSVLDRRTRSSSRDRVIADRITRQRSPGPAFRHRGRHRSGSQLSVDETHAAYRDANDENAGDDTAVVYRISQPYRTSFSAGHSVTWGRARPVQPRTTPSTDRSRSLSPTASLRSNASIMSAPPAPFSSILHNSHYRPSTGAMYPADKRRPRGRSKSPKRVTYNTRVTVRHSDTEDNMFTQLSEGEDFGLGPYEAPLRPIKSPFARSVISPRYNEFSQISPTPAGTSPTSPLSPPISHSGPSSSTPRRYDLVNNSNSNIASSSDSINRYNQPPPLPPAQRRVRDVTNTAGRGVSQQQQQQQQQQQYKPHSAPSSLPPHTPSSISDTPVRPHSQRSPVYVHQKQQGGTDFTSELVDLSQQITQMEWSPRQVRSSRGRPPPGPSSSASTNRNNNHHHHHNNNRATAVPSAASDDYDNTNAINMASKNSSSNNKHTDSMLFSPPPGGTSTSVTTAPPLGRDYVPYTSTATATVQSPQQQPVGILKDTSPQVQGQLQTGVISSGNGVVREGDIIGGRTSGSRSSPSRNNPFRAQADSSGDTDNLTG